MDRLLTKKEKKCRDKIIKSVFLRKTKFFRRNVHINHKETYLKIMRIKNDDQFLNEVGGFSQPPSDVCFFIYHLNQKTNNNKYYSVPNSDFVITDSRTNKIILINKKPTKIDAFFNVWIFRKNTVNFLSLKNGILLFTK